MERVKIDFKQVTDEWFDGGHPNPLHPIGVIINPIERVLEYHTSQGTVLAGVGDTIVTTTHILHKQEVLGQWSRE